jgi:hypothetical protein
MATSKMKPLIPTYVHNGIQALKTDVMKRAIVKCFVEDGLLGVAKLELTYQRALIAIPNLYDAADIVVPEEVEAEEDLGPVDNEPIDDVEDVIPYGLEFDIEINQVEDGDDISDSDHESEPEPVVAATVIKRSRKISCAVGSIKKGKYSR